MSRRALPELATVCWRYGTVSSLAMIVGIVLLVMTVPQLARVNTTLAMAANWLYLFAPLLAVFGYRLLRRKQDVTSEYEKMRYIAWIWGINVVFMLGGAFYLLSWMIKKWLTQ